MEFQAAYGSKRAFSSINSNDNDSESDIRLRPFKLFWDDQLQCHPILGIKHMQKLEEKLKYQFNDYSYLAQALCHKTFALEHTDKPEIISSYLYSNNNDLSSDHLSYEPLEFLGDSVLGLSAASLVHQLYPSENIAFRHDLKKNLICANTAVLCAEKLDLKNHICTGNSARSNINNKILEDSFEAVIGAMYEDSGFDFNKISEILINELLCPLLPTMQQNVINNTDRHKWKTILQEGFCPKSFVNYVTTPVGAIHPNSNASQPPPAHWESAAYIDGNLVGKGKGKKKKEAEMDAARNAYNILSST